MGPCGADVRTFAAPGKAPAVRWGGGCFPRGGRMGRLRYHPRPPTPALRPGPVTTTTLEITDLPVPGYERVVRGTDRSCGLHAIIAVHDTTLGPALGGLRMWPYASEE